MGFLQYFHGEAVGTTILKRFIGNLKQSVRYAQARWSSAKRHRKSMGDREKPERYNTPGCGGGLAERGMRNLGVMVVFMA
jgi:hypothetical protein